MPSPPSAPRPAGAGLRLLVACPGCARQYDASGREPGSRFRCSCGTVVTVPEPRSHEAEVVRCSACGAPRQAGAASCAFCGADFTLHERDLDTICPSCMARISRHARFCHACGAPVLVDEAAGEATERVCPACGDGRKLVSRRLGERAIAALECGACGGLWIGNEAFRLLAEEARAHDLPPRDHGGPLHEAAGPVRQTGPFYRACPICGQRMLRQNYGRSSGVIIDFCRLDGVWLDAQELERILEWIRRGGARLEDERAAQERLAAERRERLRKVETETLFPTQEEERRDVLTAVIEQLGRFVVRWVS
jgi:Zn-finger nucleic acid-binding protein